MDHLYELTKLMDARKKTKKIYKYIQSSMNVIRKKLKNT